jgi:hypothetical protein
LTSEAKGILPICGALVKRKARVKEQSPLNCGLCRNVH